MGMAGRAGLGRARAVGIAALAFACVMTASAATAQDCPRGEVAAAGACATAEQAAEGIRKIVRDTMGGSDLRAVIVSVKVGDTPLLTEAWGQSMTGVPATTDMNFRNGAVAIAYLSTVLLQLQDKGLLSLDDTLSKWFPQYPMADRVTLRMLIGSTSGYADYVNLDVLPLYKDVFRQWTPDELIGMGLSQPMKCEPGACFAYAHTNFIILGEVLRRVTGRPVADLLKEGVLAPLGLRNTRSEETARIEEPVLHAFTSERGIYEDSTHWNPSWTLARGAVMTTDIADLLASAIAIGSGSLLSPEAGRQQIAPPSPMRAPFAPDFYYGLGVVVTKSWVIQTPSFAGYSAVMAYLPARRIAIAVSATRGPTTPDQPPPADLLFARLGAYLARDQAPRMPGGG